MLYPNGRHLMRNSNRAFGPAPGADSWATRRQARNQFVNCCPVRARNASTPDGYGMATPFGPYTAGSMAARQAVLDVAMACELLSGGLMVGEGSLQLDGSADMGLIVTLVGDGTTSLTGDNLVLAGVVQLQATGTMTLDATCNLGLIVPMSGDGTLSLSGTSDLRGLLSLSGTWDEVAGELTASAVAAAVWADQEAQRLLTIGVGNVSDAGTALEKFDYGTSHADVTVDASGNRTIAWT